MSVMIILWKLLPDSDCIRNWKNKKIMIAHKSDKKKITVHKIKSTHNMPSNCIMALSSTLNNLFKKCSIIL